MKWFVPIGFQNLSADASKKGVSVFGEIFRQRRRMRYRQRRESFITPSVDCQGFIGRKLRKYRLSKLICFKGEAGFEERSALFVSSHCLGMPLACVRIVAVAIEQLQVKEVKGSCRYKLRETFLAGVSRPLSWSWKSEGHNGQFWLPLSAATRACAQCL